MADRRRTKNEGRAGLTREKSSINSRLKGKCKVETKLIADLEKLQRSVGMGFEVIVKWLPGTVKYKDGKQLLEEVSGDTIILYTEDSAETTRLLAHGFAEWLLNRHTKRYRLFINKLIELFEEIQYDEKEKLIDAITKLSFNF